MLYLAVDLAVFRRLTGYPLDNKGRPRVDASGVPLNRLIFGPPTGASTTTPDATRVPSYGIQIPVAKSPYDAAHGYTSNDPDAVRLFEKGFDPNGFRQVPVFSENIDGRKWADVWPCVTFRWTDEEHDDSTSMFFDDMESTDARYPDTTIVDRFGDEFTGPTRVNHYPHPEQWVQKYMIRAYAKSPQELGLICEQIKRIFPPKCGLEVEFADGSTHVSDMILESVVNLDLKGNEISKALAGEEQSYYSRAFNYRIEAYEDNTVNKFGNRLVQNSRTILTHIFSLTDLQDELYEVAVQEFEVADGASTARIAGTVRGLTATASGTVVGHDAAVIAGTVGGMTGTMLAAADTVGGEVDADLAGTLGGLTGVIGSTLSFGADVAGTVGGMTGAISTTMQFDASIAGSLGGMTGVVSATLSFDASVAGTLGGITGVVSGTTTTPFHPTDIAGLVLGIDPREIGDLAQDAGGTVPVTTNGDPVRFANDQSSNNLDLTANADAQRTTYNATTEMLAFDGVDDAMRCAAVPLTGDGAWTAIFVMKTAGSVPDCGVFGFGDGAIGATMFGTIGLFLSHIGPDQLSVECYGSTSAGFANDTVTSGVRHVVTVRKEPGALSATVRVWLNSVELIQTTVPSVDVPNIAAPAVFSIGAWAEYSAGLRYTGELGPFYLYDTALSDVNRTSVENFCL